MIRNSTEGCRQSGRKRGFAMVAFSRPPAEPSRSPRRHLLHQEDADLIATKTIFIQQPSSWDAVATSLKQLSRGHAEAVRFAGAIDELDEDTNAIDVVVFSVEGMAKYALEIHEKGMLNLPNDTIGMHMACSIHADVLTPDRVGSALAWLLRPNGILERVTLNTDELAAARVEYRVGEQMDESEPE